VSNIKRITRNIKARISTFMLAVIVGASPSYAAGVTAGDILREMPDREFIVYISGMVEGFAYSRFRKDTLEAGERTETGMECIYDWFFNNPGVTLTIEDAFQQHSEHGPSTVLGAMLKQECGE